MSLFKCGAAALIAALLGGCASAPEQIADNAAQGATEADDAPIAAASEISAASADLQPTVIEIDVRNLDPGLVVTCRDMLQTASNTLVTRCMTRDDWKRYEQVEARQAAETVRRMQGDPFP